MIVNRQAIQRVVMRGESIPTGVIVPPFANGWTKELDTPPKVDLAAAKKLMADAGYANGFTTTLHCPNDRYINDEAICQAAVGMWGQIGIKVNLVSQSKSIHFTLIQKNPPETNFYMVGWAFPPLTAIMSSPSCTIPVPAASAAGTPPAIPTRSWTARSSP